jgi:hypothetical protein
MFLNIKPDGTAIAIYSEEFDLNTLGKVEFRRASRVEPDGDPPMWYADMQLSGGPILGPFQTRSQALEAEVKWLKQKLSKSSDS